MYIASFDIFDTVLTRVVGEPRTIFLLLGKQLNLESLIKCTPEAFINARIQAENLVYGNIGEKCSLEKIYIELGIKLRLTPEKSQVIMQKELAIESQLLQPVPTAKEMLKTARKQKQQIMFVSDMYLPSEFLKQQLLKHSLWEDGDLIYVSNEYGKSKPSGELFREIINIHHVHPHQILHHGNDLISDIQGGKKAGLRVKHFTETALNRYEKILEDYGYATEGLSSVMAGASRLTRLRNPTSSLYQKALQEVALGVIAPTLIGYVLWILQQSKMMNLKRLYFVSRDGEVLLAIAKKLADKLNIDCELRYVYGSRIAWNLPALASLNNQEAIKFLKRSSWLLDTTSNTSIHEFLARVSIVPEEVNDHLTKIGFTQQDWLKILNPREQKKLHSLIDNEEFREIIFEKAYQAKQILQQYLDQEGLLDYTTKGLVDIGWFGSSYDSLAAILNTHDAKLDAGFFFGIRKNNNNQQSEQKKGYFFDERQQIGFKQFLPNYGIVPLEMFCTAEHGTVISFREENGQIKPVFREESNQKVIDWGLPLVRKSIDCFIDNLLLDETLVNPGADVREATADVLKCFWLNPSQAEAYTWGDFPWEKGHSESTESLAIPYNLTDILQSFLTRKLPDNQNIWLQGSIAKSSPMIRIGIKGFIKYQKLLSSIKSRSMLF